MEQKNKWEQTIMWLTMLLTKPWGLALTAFIALVIWNICIILMGATIGKVALLFVMMCIFYTVASIAYKVYRAKNKRIWIIAAISGALVVVMFAGYDGEIDFHSKAISGLLIPASLFGLGIAAVKTDNKEKE